MGSLPLGISENFAGLSQDASKPALRGMGIPPLGAFPDRRILKAKVVWAVA